MTEFRARLTNEVQLRRHSASMLLAARSGLAMNSDSTASAMKHYKVQSNTGIVKLIKKHELISRSSKRAEIIGYIK